MVGIKMYSFDRSRRQYSHLPLFVSLFSKENINKRRRKQIFVSLIILIAKRVECSVEIVYYLWWPWLY